MAKLKNSTDKENKTAQKKLKALCATYGVKNLSFDTKPDSRLWHSLVLKMCGLRPLSKGRPKDIKAKEMGELAYLLSDFWAETQKSKTGKKPKMEVIYDEVIKTLGIQPKPKAHGGLTETRNTARRAYQKEKTKRKGSKPRKKGPKIKNK